MELNDRIAAVRKAAGLTQEQLGELVGVSRQAVSKWEAGQTVPDAVTMAVLCEALHVSADYVLLGKEPENNGAASPVYTMPDTCPCCGRKVSGTICPFCAYHIPSFPPRGPRYAVISTNWGASNQEKAAAELEKYCGLSQDHARAIIEQAAHGSYVLLRRDLSDNAAQYMASCLDRSFLSLRISLLGLRIVEDCGEEDDGALLDKPPAIELPDQSKSDGIGFWGVVGAVIVALLILSFL